MKKAVAYIDHRAILELLKVPHTITLAGMEYPSKEGKIKLIFTGDALPVRRASAKAKRLPEIKYTVLRHWHQAKIEPKTKESQDNGD